MFRLPDIAIGAIIAALIAGIVSLIGLIISKEQKVSEFRQSWIDALRTELTCYLSNLNAICDKLTASYVTHNDKIAALSEHYTAFNNAAFSIKLRLNPDEQKTKNLIKHMLRFQNILMDEPSITPQNIRPTEAEFLTCAQDILRAEWKRVKTGEITFIIAKWCAVTTVALSLTYVAIALSNSNSNASRRGDTQSENSTKNMPFRNPQVVEPSKTSSTK